MNNKLKMAPVLVIVMCALLRGQHLSGMGRLTKTVVKFSSSGTAFGLKGEETSPRDKKSNPVWTLIKNNPGKLLCTLGVFGLACWIKYALFDEELSEVELQAQNLKERAKKLSVGLELQGIVLNKVQENSKQLAQDMKQDLNKVENLKKTSSTLVTQDDVSAQINALNNSTDGVVNNMKNNGGSRHQVVMRDGSKGARRESANQV